MIEPAVSLLLERADRLRGHELRMRRRAAESGLPPWLRYQAAVNATDLAEEALRCDRLAAQLDPRCR